MKTYEELYKTIRFLFVFNSIFGFSLVFPYGENRYNN